MKIWDSDVETSIVALGIIFNNGLIAKLWRNNIGSLT
ncbi:hypothetical protein T4A_8 [Trichinella pseudospiralis]|uniref:Uncharacterized protein n=1 Tax=Trichinella pseudospiralis TaxID=6337 RepID=A0A0V1DPH2_TRIPS|nr:hypothetical protein T4A_8 [Trichinella pseudospiralis]